MSEQPTITVSSASNAAFLGTMQTVNISFSNTGDAAGFDPFVLLSLDNLGVNGAGTGISFNNATYLGLPVASTVVTFDGSGDYSIPGSIGADGNPIVVTGGTPNGQGVLLQLPFGSFTPGQTPADIAVSLNVSANADTAPGKTLAVTAAGGFLYGSSAMGNSTASPTLITPNTTLDFQPTVLSVNSVYLGPSGVMVTGPTNFQTLEVFGDVAAGATVTNETLIESLPNGAVATKVTLNDGQGHSYVYTVDPVSGTLSAVTPGGLPIVTSAAALASSPGVWFNAAANQIEANFGTVLGNATHIGADTGPSIATEFYTGQTQSLGTSELVPTVTTADLTVTDFLPYGAVAQSITLSSDNGIFVYSYSAAQGLQLTTQTAGSTAPAITAGPGPSGTSWVTYDAANGEIVSDFGTVQAGHAAEISAQWQGGQYQQPGTVTETVAAGQTVNNLTLVDQLNGGAVANSVTLQVGANSYVYTVSGGTLSFDAAHSSSASGAPGVVGSAGALANAAGVYYDAAHNRIEANFGTVSGGAGGTSASIGAGFSGAALIDLATPSNVPTGGGASAAASYSSAAYGVSAASATLPSSSGNAGIPGRTVISNQLVALQKSVASSGPVAPGDTLTWTLNGEISNYADVRNVVVTDTLGDGQTYMGAPTLTAVSNGQTIYTGALTDTGVATKNAAGQTILTFNVSQQLLDAGQADDFNGGAAPTDAVAKPAAADFKITFTSQVDTTYSATSPAPHNPTIEAGDTIANPQAVITGNLVNGGAAVSATASASTSIPTAHLTKSVYEVNGQAYTGQHIQAGDVVTYELKETVPIFKASDVSLTDFLPLPIYNVTDTTGTPGSGFSFDASAAGTTPSAGIITFGPANTVTSATGLLATPQVSVNALSNSLTVNLGSIDNTHSNATGTIDLLFSARVLDQPFIDGLLLTNQVTGTETNSFGAVATQNAIAQVTLGQPVLNVEKAVVATTGQALFSGTRGPVTFAGPGMTGVAFSGTIDSASLAATKLADSLAGAQGGDYERFAVTIENIGSGPQGAFDVVLKDTLPTGFVIPASGLDLVVTNGAGQILTYTGNAADLFTTGIQLVDPSSSQGALAAYNATSGANIAVLTYDLEVQPNVPAPNYVMTNTATVTRFAAVEGGTNFVGNRDQGTLSASSTVTTQAPIATKTVTATSESATGADAQSLKIGETVTYTITETLAEGMLSGAVINDVLDGNSGHLVFLSGVVTGIGGAISNTAGVVVGSTLTAAGTTGASLALGNVTVMSGALGPDETITYTVTAAYQGGNAGNAGGQTLVNSASITAADPNTAGATVSTGAAQASVHSVAPELTLVKQARDLTAGGSFSTNAIVTAGDTVEYQVTLTNGNDGNAANAFNVDLKDLLASFGTDALGQPNVSFLGGTAVATSSNAQGVSIVSGGHVGDSTIEVTAATLDTNGTITVTFDGVVSPNAVFGAAIPNTATSTADTLPGTDPNAGNPAYNRVITKTASAGLTSTVPSGTKTIAATSSIDTTGTTLTIGEVATYTIQIAVPEGNSSDLKVVDTLPTGLSYQAGAPLSGIAAVVDTGVTSTGGIDLTTIGAGGITLTPGTADSAGFIHTVTYDLGPVQAGAGGGTVALSFNALVDNLASNVTGTTLTNTVKTYSGGTLDSTHTARATVALGGLSGHVWTDQNANGVQDGGDANLAGITVDLLNSLGVATGATAVTNASGAYSFTNLVDGAYAVKVLAPGERFSPVGTSGTAASNSIVDSTGQTASVAVNAGTVTPNQNAAVYVPAQLSGTVFTDQNANGVLNGGDGGIANQTVTLIGTGPSAGVTTLTDASGNYSFTGLTPGSYAVTVTVPAGENISPVGSSGALPDSLVNAAGTTPVVTLTSGANVVNQDAGEYQFAALSGHVFLDQNDNGQQNAPGDSNLQGVTVTLLNSLGASTGTTAVTDQNGFYQFTGLIPGTYSVQVAAPAATPDFARVGGPTSPIDSIVAGNGKTPPVTLISGQTQPDQNAGVYAPASITGDVFKDLNDNGVQDLPGDVAIQGVTLDLQVGGVTTASTTTDVNGNYSFTNLAPGSYTVHVVTPAGGTVSPQVTTGSLALDSAVAQATGTTPVITLISGQTMPYQNAGITGPGALSGDVFLDQNADGVQQGGDGGIRGVTVDLFNGGAAPIASTTTDVNGNYSFTGLLPGSYSVALVKPAAADVFSPMQGSAAAANSIVNPASGTTVPVAVIEGQTTPFQNAGLYVPAQLSGNVFLDQNANGVKQAGDTNLAGQTVTLLTGTGGATGQSTTTDASGNYAFTNLTPGSYEVKVTPVAGDLFSPVGGPVNAVDSLVNSAGVTPAVTLVSGASQPNQNAGEFAYAALSGHVWLDQNANGVQEGGDANLAGVTVALLNNLGAATGATLVTDSNGFYDFTNLVPGTYSVAVTPPAAEPLFATQQSTTGPVDSIVNTLSGKTAPVTLVSGQTQPDQNAGVFANAAITGHVFKDFNDNGVQDSADTNLAGITIDLLDGSGVATGATAVTDAHGAYSFTGLRPGTYEAHVEAPALDKISPQQAISATTSVVDTNGTTAPITLVSGETQPNENAGLFPPQPNLSITKTTGFTTGAAGDIVTYNVTVAEANGDPNPAYNITVKDLLAPGESLVSGSEHASVGTVTETGSGFVLNVGSLLSGQAPITLTYQAVLTSAVYDGEAITNTASLAYDGAASNGITYTGSAQQTVNAHLVDQFAKSLVTTSQNGGNLVIPGETVSFDLTATVAPGTQHLVLSDALPSGLSAVSARLISEGNASGTVAVGSSFTPLGGVLTADLGIITSPGTNRTAPGDQVVVRVTATVGSNDAFNQLITNQGTLTATTPAGAPQQVLHATSPVQVVQPGTISAFVFLDAQCTGTYHVGDPGVAGVTVRLLDGYGQATGVTAITDNHGEYSFSAVIPGQYKIQVLTPQGTDLSDQEHASGNPALDSDVNPVTGISDLLTVGAGQTVINANAGLEFNGHFAGVTPINIGTGGYDGNGGSGVIVGAGGNLVHTGSGGDNFVILDGKGVPSLVEAGGGHGTDIVTSCGPLNAQTQNASNGFLFAAGSGSDLQGGSGNTYLMGGAGGNNLIANGSGNNVLIAGGPNSELRTGGLSSTILYQVGDGALQVDNGMNSTSTLDVFGATSGTLEIINSQEYLDLGHGDLIHFNGGTPFDHLTGVITNANAPNSIHFFANIATAPQEVVSFPAMGAPTILASASLTTVTQAPTMW